MSEKGFHKNTEQVSGDHVSKELQLIAGVAMNLDSIKAFSVKVGVAPTYLTNK